MVGEIRDNETAELAIHASLTGHFLLSTLHTNDSIGAIPRFVDMGVEPFLLGSTLKVVVAQRLVRKICPYCKTEEKLPPDILKEIEKYFYAIPPKIIQEAKLEEIKNINDFVFYRGKGCPRCGNTGYHGRIAIVEIFEVNKRIKEIIMDKNRILSLDDVRHDQDFITIKQDGIIKSLQGLTTIEEVLRVVRK